VLPAKLTSDPVNPVTGSLKTTVKSTGEALVGSTCATAWSMVTVGGVEGTMAMSVGWTPTATGVERVFVARSMIDTLFANWLTM
jgi:hypothetical protein